MNEKDQVNLFLVGAPKAATSAIADHLGRHQDVFLPSIKEPHYFSNVPRLGPTKPISNFRAYQRLFHAAGGHRYLCDASTTYLYFNGTAERIHAHCERAKIIISLREPAQRAFSHYLMDRHAIAHEVASVREAMLDPHYYGKYGFHGMEENPYIYPSRYYIHVKRFIEKFGRNRVKIVFSENLRKDPGKFFSDIFEFLELKYDDTLPVREANTRRRTRYPRLNRFVRNLTPVSISSATPFAIKKIIHRWLYAELPAQSLPPDVESVMNKNFFEEDVAELRRLIGDIDPWKIGRK